MFSKQKGLWPLVLLVTGLSLHIIFIGLTIPYVVLIISDIFSEAAIPVAIISTLEFMAGMIGLIWSIPLLIGSFCISAFPEIRIFEKGIECRTYKFIRSKIYWNEIIDVISLPKGYMALTISRRGSPLLNGLYSNKIYGGIVKSKYPVLLLSPHLENKEVLLREITSHLTTKCLPNET